MYKSPIELLVDNILHQIVKEQDEEIYKAVVHYIPNVDKEELIKALRYDREQYEKGYADAMATMPKWIPVTERLPEDHDRYLCNVKSFAFKGAYYQTILKYDKGGFIEGHIYTDDVTHWMPLPTPPKGEEQ